MGITKYNKNEPLFTFHAPDNFEYYRLSSFAADADTDKVFNLRGFFIGEGKQYGKSPVAVTDFCYINLPKHMLDTVQKILSDQEAVDEINRGEAGFKIYSYTPKTGGTAYNITFVKTAGFDQSELPF